MKAVDDIAVMENLILLSCGIALVLGLIWMVVMKCCAPCMTWTVIILTMVLSFYMTHYVYERGLEEAAI